MKHTPIILMTLLLGLTLFGCKKQEPETLTPKIKNDKVETSAATATFTWTVDWPGKLISVVEVSENEDMSHSQFYGSETETDNHNFSVTVSDLKVSKKYYYRHVVWNHFYADNKFVMEGKSFTTKTDVPKVKTVEVTDVTRTTATVIGEVTDECGSEVTERGVCWGTSHNPTTSGSHLNNGTGLGTYSIVIPNLSAEQTYYVRTYAVNSEGTTYSEEELSFITGDAVKPTVTTAEVTNIKWRTATSGGELVDDGGAALIDCGICWSTSANPEVSDGCISIGIGTGSYTINMTRLLSNTIYYVRAYAVNRVGISYGNEVTFSTLQQPPAPIGAINGLFSVSDSQQVWFSQGNLQYNAVQGTHSIASGGSVQGTWRFAENQWDYIGSANANISSTYDGWIDLFGWGTSGWNCGNTYYRPWDANHSCPECYGPYGDNSLTGSFANSDWGVYNAISNGGNQAGLWRMLEGSWSGSNEWGYILTTRTTSSGIRYAMAQVTDTDLGTVNGLILFPDDWSTTIYNPNNPNNQSGASYSNNVISVTQWNDLEQHGAVFLPAAGYRSGTLVGDAGSGGCYWLATYLDYYNAGSVYFLNWSPMTFERYEGQSVRLVYPAE